MWYLCKAIPVPPCELRGGIVLLASDREMTERDWIQMSVAAVVGMQWGDEGKGKIVDMLGQDADLIIRCQGGGNAGHTVVVQGDVYKLHFIPSGILHRNAVCVIGNGVVLDPVVMVEEIAALEKRGVSTRDRLFISDRVHMVMPTHKLLDGVSEKQLGSKKIGTTGRGIGPTYADKANRCGLRGHLLKDEKAFREAACELMQLHNRRIEWLGGTPQDIDAALPVLLAARKTLEPYVADTAEMAWTSYAANKRILLEGAQGMHLDIDYGTYPYVTSSNTTTAGLFTGSGLPPASVAQVNGCIKAFTTRVGEGPFVTELAGDLAGRLRGTGSNQWDEFGTTTGRPRRCGWLDLVVARYAARINGVTHLHITKLDVLSGFEELQVCVGYHLDGREIGVIPASLGDLERCRPVYRTLEGWNEPLAGISSFDRLPKAAREYCRFIAEFTGAKIGSVGVGPAREHTICL